jgi:hypothetical protein
MSFEFTERYFKLGHETTWGSLAPNREHVQYLLSGEITASRSRIEEDLVSPSRQARSRAFTKLEVSGSMEFNPLSSRIFYYALGSETDDPDSPYTIRISGAGTLPSLSIEEGFRIPGAETVILGYTGLKVDRLELRFEREEDITVSADLVGKGTASITGTWESLAPTGLWKGYPMTYVDAKYYWGDTAISLNRLSVEINNNLSAKFSGFGGSYEATAIKEGTQVIQGRMVIDSSILAWLSRAVPTPSEGTLKVSFGNADLGTVDISLYRVVLDEFPIRLRGREELEVEIPFVARTSGPGSYDAITIEHRHPSKGTLSELPW